MYLPECVGSVIIFPPLISQSGREQVLSRPVNMLSGQLITGCGAKPDCYRVDEDDGVDMGQELLWQAELHQLSQEEHHLLALKGSILNVDVPLPLLKDNGSKVLKGF